jgi:hypothetical protein
MNRLSIYSFVLLVFCAASVPAQSNHRMTLEDLRHLRLPEVALDNVIAVNADAQKDSHEVSHVKVEGTIGGNIRFELLLPDAWNSRFVMGGGGGFVGTVQNSARYTVNLGYATVGTDTGHESSVGLSGAWAYTNLEAEVDFGYLAVHRTAEVAKAIIRSYYGADAEHSYFTGCSRGGGQAMMEAQRFPNDFDGIVSGAPAFNWTGLAAMSVNIAQTLYPDPNHLEKTALDLPALQKLQNAIIEQCDEQDGLKDGVVQDPPSVHFDLSKVAGLTDDQRKSIETIYHGAYSGEKLLYPGYTPGSECDPNQWKLWIVGPVQLDPQVHSPDLMFAFGTQIWKYLIYNNPDWDYSTYKFSNFASDTVAAASCLNATNPNLDALKAHHGKLIIWHGWADTALPAQATVDYYRQVEAHDPNAADYCRLFMVPGCLHCGGGPGASDLDWLSAIVNWVEHAQSPDRLIASKKENGKVTVTRPIFPFPMVAFYKGSGDPNKAENFEAKLPSGRR